MPRNSQTQSRGGSSRGQYWGDRVTAQDPGFHSCLCFLTLWKTPGPDGVADVNGQQKLFSASGHLSFQPPLRGLLPVSSDGRLSICPALVAFCLRPSPQPRQPTWRQARRTEKRGEVNGRRRPRPAGRWRRPPTVPGGLAGHPSLGACGGDLDDRMMDP